MSRLAATLRREATLQLRYRLYAVSVLMVLVWGALLGLLPAAARAATAVVVPTFVVFNLVVTTFYFAGALAVVDSPRALKLRHGRRTVRVESTADGRRERQDFPLDGIAENPEFLAALRRPGLETIHTQETTLEEVFLEVTGRSLG